MLLWVLERQGSHSREGSQLPAEKLLREAKVTEEPHWPSLKCLRGLRLIERSRFLRYGSVWAHGSPPVQWQGHLVGSQALKKRTLSSKDSILLPRLLNGLPVLALDSHPACSLPMFPHHFHWGGGLGMDSPRVAPKGPCWRVCPVAHPQPYPRALLQTCCLLLLQPSGSSRWPTRSALQGTAPCRSPGPWPIASPAPLRLWALNHVPENSSNEAMPGPQKPLSYSELGLLMPPTSPLCGCWSLPSIFLYFFLHPYP